MGHLRAECLLDEGSDRGIKWFDFGPNTLAQFYWREVNVEARRVNIFMTSKERNIIQIDPSSFEHGTALVTQGMGGQRRQTDPFTNALDNLVKSSNGKGTARVASRLRQENRASVLAIVGCDESTAVPLNVDAHQM